MLHELGYFHSNIRLPLDNSRCETEHELSQFTATLRLDQPFATSPAPLGHCVLLVRPAGDVCLKTPQALDGLVLVTNLCAMEAG